MAAEIPTSEPTSFQAGVTVKWTKALSDYPYSDGWRLTYYLRGKSNLDIATTADTDGRGFSVTISATSTAQLEAGDYWLEGRVALSDETYSIGPRLSVTVLPNFTDASAVAGGFDGRSHARKCRDALRSIIENTSGNLVVDYTIFGERNVKLMTVEERLKLLNYYESRVAEEEKAERIARGEKAGVYMRFTSVR